MNEIGDGMKCEICGSEKFVDAHHYDCREGEISSETILLCRRCHRTYHAFGIEWFDDEYLDKAIELENRHREIYNANLEYFEKERTAKAAQFPWSQMLKKPITPLPLLKREDIKRPAYWNKIHGLKTSRRSLRETKNEKQLGFAVIDKLLMKETDSR